MPTTFLSLPPEIRIMIFEYVFAGIAVRYEPRMYRPPYRRLTERYLQLLAPEVHLLFTCKQLLAEARPVLLRQATVNISNICATKLPQRHAFMESFVYPAIKRVRFSGRHSGLPRALEAIIPQLRQLVHLELGVLEPYTWWIDHTDLQEFAREGITSEALDSVSTNFMQGLMRFKGAIEVWKGLDTASSCTATCIMTCKLSFFYLRNLWPYPTPSCQWVVTSDLRNDLITLTPVDAAGTTHRAKTIPMPDWIDSSEED